jgi:anti-sigma factor RsiW
MTQEHEQYEDLLSAYADGELDDRAELESHLAACATCTARLADYRAIGDSLRRQAREEPASAALRARVAAAISGAEAAAASPWARRRRRMWSPGVLAAAAAVVLAVGVAFSGWGRGNDTSVAREVLDSHVRSLAGDQAHLFDVPSTDAHTVKPWFSGKLDFAPSVVDFAPNGFPLLGGRVDYIAGQRVAALVYGRRKHVINLYEWPGGADARATGELRLGYSMLHWTHAGMAYWAVSDASSSDLKELARNIDTLSR